MLLSAGHALEFYITKEQRQEHPEWKAEIGGKPDEMRLRWSHPGVAAAIADKILAGQAAAPAASWSLSPLGRTGSGSCAPKWEGPLCPDFAPKAFGAPAFKSSCL